MQLLVLAFGAPGGAVQPANGPGAGTTPLQPQSLELSAPNSFLSFSPPLFLIFLIVV